MLYHSPYIFILRVCTRTYLYILHELKYLTMIEVSTELFSFIGPSFVIIFLVFIYAIKNLNCFPIVYITFKQ